MKKEELLEKMENSTEELIKETDQLSDKEFETTVVTGSWTAKEILSHVAAWDLEFVAMSKNLLKGEGLPKNLNFDTFNAREVLKRKNMTRKEIVDEVRRNRKAYTAFISGFTPEQLDEPKGKKVTVGSLADDITSHDQYHLQQIKKKK